MKANSHLLLLTLVIIFGDCKDKTEDPGSGVTFQTFDCSECTFIISDSQTNGPALGAKPGDIICLQTGIPYKKLLFTEIVGTADAPIIIRNCGGQAVVSSPDGFGIKFQDSKNFKLLGDGGDTQYGIKVTTEDGFYVAMEHFTTDFEIQRLEIAGKNPNGIGTGSGFAGFGIKTSPYQACDVFTDPTRMAWIMRNVSIHDNYIHDTGGEGLYIGHGFYTGRQESQCSQITYSHSIKGLRVYNNKIENVGYDGIQVKNADEDVAVYNNWVNNYGTKNESGQQQGLFIGAGTTGAFYNNVIINGTGNGMQLHALGNNDIYNNIVANAGIHGFYAVVGDFNVRLPNGYFNIMNNVFVNSAQDGFAFFSDTGGPKRIYNNIIAKAGKDIFRNGAPTTLDSANNIVTQFINLPQFVDISKEDFTLNASSPCIDKGKDVSSFGITKDILGVTRPQGAGFDIGPYERKP